MTAAGAAISISNSGPVIAPDEVDNLFQPFRQSGTERIRNGEGYGLGLAIVHAIADAHGAAIATRARPQGGLGIEVNFPSRPADHPDAARCMSVHSWKQPNLTDPARESVARPVPIRRR
jgi:signal transduction histidine kinase